MDKDYISHHGIKGMKWGVRRTPAQLGHKPTAKKNSFRQFIQSQKRKDAQAAKKKESTKPKKISEMTDDEIRKRIARLELEADYRKALSGASTKKQSSAKTFISKIGSSSVSQFQKSLGEKIGKKAANVVWASLFGDPGSGEKKDKKDD